MTIDKDLQKELALYGDEDETWSYPDLDESVYNPANDEFKRTLQVIKMQIRQLTLKMRPRHAMMVKVNMNVDNFAQTARRLKSTPQTISRVWNSPDGQKLRNLLTHHNQLMSGVSAIEREQLLWRIALNNEEINPRTSVSAIAEINKMKADTQADEAKREAEKTIGEQPQVIIQLNDPRLLPSKLDQHTMKDIN